MKTMADSNMVRDSQEPLLVIADLEDLVAPVAGSGADQDAAQPDAPPASAKRPARGSTAAAPVAEPAPAPVSAPVPAPAPAAAPVVAPQPAAPAAPVARERRTAGGFRRLIPLAAVSLAVVASSVSVIGILVASRMVARTNVVLEQIEAHQGKVRELDALIVQVDGLRQREQIALDRLERLSAGKPATVEEVRAAVSGLQLAMARSQSGGSMGLMTSVRDAQAELADRISTIYRRVERIDEKVGLLVSSSPKARRAGDPAPIS